MIVVSLRWGKKSTRGLLKKNLPNGEILSVMPHHPIVRVRLLNDWISCKAMYFNLVVLDSRCDARIPRSSSLVFAFWIAWMA